MNDLFDKLSKENVLVSDGAIGSLLFEKGLNPAIALSVLT